MRLLLDTHVLLWWLDDPLLLSLAARKAIESGNNDVFISAVVVWELIIKKALGKLTIPENLEEVIGQQQFEQLPITIPHALALESLPTLHNDPFDRILLAQAKAENLILVTRDQNIKNYGIPYLSA